GQAGIVVAHHRGLGPQLLQVAHDRVDEAVVVVDHQDGAHAESPTVCSLKGTSGSTAGKTQTNSTATTARMRISANSTRTAVGPGSLRQTQPYITRFLPKRRAGPPPAGTSSPVRRAPRTAPPSATADGSSSESSSPPTAPPLVPRAPVRSLPPGPERRSNGPRRCTRTRPGPCGRW